MHPSHKNGDSKMIPPAVVPVCLRAPSGRTAVYYVPQGRVAPEAEMQRQIQQMQQLRAPNQAQLAQLRVGDVVYRQGQLASVVAVDQSLCPPSYVVRMAQSGDEVNCELKNLVVPNGLDMPRQTIPEQPQSFASFADMVRQRVELEELVPGKEAEIYRGSQVPEVSRDLQTPNPDMTVETDVPQEETDEAELGPDMRCEFSSESYLNQQAQMWQQANWAYESYQQQLLQMQQMQYEVPQASDYQFHMDYPAQAAQAAQATQAAQADGDSKNYALQALTEALDRAEVDMLTGGRARRSDDVSEAMRQCGYDAWLCFSGDFFIFGLAKAPFGGYFFEGFSSKCKDGGALDGSTSNFALKAATEALNRALNEKPKMDFGNDLDNSMLMALGLQQNPASKERKLQKHQDELGSLALERPKGAEFPPSEDLGGFMRLSGDLADEWMPHPQQEAIDEGKAEDCDVDGWHPMAEQEVVDPRQHVTHSVQQQEVNDEELARPEQKQLRLNCEVQHSVATQEYMPVQRQESLFTPPLVAPEKAQAQTPPMERQEEAECQKYLLDFVLPPDRLGPGRATLPNFARVSRKVLTGPGATASEGMGRLTPRQPHKTFQPRHSRDHLVDFVLDGPPTRKNSQAAKISCYGDFPKKKLTPRRQGGKVQPTSLPPLSKKMYWQ